MLKVAIPSTESKTEEQIREQYEIEKRLANRLRNASNDERKLLYTKVYDEYFQLIPNHPHLLRKADPQKERAHADKQLKALRRFLNPNDTFMELGAGSCSVSLEVAKFVKKVYAIEVSNEIVQKENIPENFNLIISDGNSVDVPPKSINVAYSNQLIEHLHQDDVMCQMKSIYRALAPGGIYICKTPHVFKGPCDISKYFDNKATGLHLKEYKTSELIAIFRQVGFKNVKIIGEIKQLVWTMPSLPVLIIERLLNPISHDIRRKLATSIPLRYIFSNSLLARK